MAPTLKSIREIAKERQAKQKEQQAKQAKQKRDYWVDQMLATFFGKKTTPINPVMNSTTTGAHELKSINLVKQPDTGSPPELSNIQEMIASTPTRRNLASDPRIATPDVLALLNQTTPVAPRTTDEMELKPERHIADWETVLMPKFTLPIRPAKEIIAEDKPTPEPIGDLLVENDLVESDLKIDEAFTGIRWLQEMVAADERASGHPFQPSQPLASSSGPLEAFSPCFRLDVPEVDIIFPEVSIWPDTVPTPEPEVKQPRCTTTTVPGAEFDPSPHYLVASAICNHQIGHPHSVPEIIQLNPWNYTCLLLMGQDSYICENKQARYELNFLLDDNTAICLGDQ